MSWTDFSGDTNDNTNTVRQIIQGNTVINLTLDRGEYIGQHNEGQHAALFGEVQSHLVGLDVPVPIVDSNGHFQGWAVYHIVNASQGGRSITGYFKSNFVGQKLTIQSCAIDVDCPRYLGAYTLHLIE